MAFIAIVLSVLSALTGLLILPLSVIFLYDYFTAPEKQRVKNFDYEHQTEEDENGIRRRHFTGKPEEVGFTFPKTLYENFQRGMQVSGDGDLYGVRATPTAPYTWIKYSDVFKRAKNFGAGLVAKGLLPQNDTFIGIQAQNSVDWVVVEQATNAYSMVIVPLYDTLGVEACNYIINFMSITTVVVDTAERFKSIVTNVSKLKPLTRIICVADIPEDLRRIAEDANVEVFAFNDIENLGKEKPHDVVPPKPSDLATICCTSGTTGDPKGVLITHENFMAEDEALVNHMLPLRFDPNDVVISYLPLAHLYERLVHIVMITHGAKVGFFTGDVRRLTDDIKALRPTLLPAVPRVLGRVYAGVWKKARENYVTRAILHIAFRMKRLEVYRGIIRQDSVWDKLVFKNVRKQLGDRLRFILTGSAPIEGDVLTFLRVALGIPILEGYGQTESTGGATLTVIGDNTVEQVGPPMVGVEVKLVDVPDMDYKASEGTGEVCIRGKIIMQGYYKLDAKTKEALDDEGWLHTGDVGTWDEKGCLKIIDRKKNLFKLSQGEYIAPEKLEQSFGKSKMFVQVFVDGNSKYAFPVALVAPEKDVLMKFAKEVGLDTSSYDKLLESKPAKDYILKEFARIAKKDMIKSFEVPKAVHLMKEPFSVANNMLTPTFKAKREVVRKNYKEIVDKLYKEVQEE